MTLIPTGRRQHLPKHLAYPVGAEVVSAALGDVSQFGTLQLNFSEPHHDNVISVSFAPTSGLWSFVVHAVPSALKARVREQLSPEGLARVAGWMRIERAETWYLQRQQFVVGYDAEPS